jgi:ubiquitin carboxyl-terminal hydrolase 25
LVDSLSKLFASMIMANRKYVDPTAVLTAVTDDYGNPVLIGEQRDIGEFNLNFLERIEEGLGERRKDISDSMQIDDLSNTGKNRAFKAEEDNFL